MSRKKITTPFSVEKLKNLIRLISGLLIHGYTDDLDQLHVFFSKNGLLCHIIVTLFSANSTRASKLLVKAYKVWPKKTISMRADWKLPRNPEDVCLDDLMEYRRSISDEKIDETYDLIKNGKIISSENFQTLFVDTTR